MVLLLRVGGITAGLLLTAAPALLPGLGAAPSLLSAPSGLAGLFVTPTLLAGLFVTPTLLAGLFVAPTLLTGLFMAPILLTGAIGSPSGLPTTPALLSGLVAAPSRLLSGWGAPTGLVSGLSGSTAVCAGRRIRSATGLGVAGLTGGLGLPGLPRFLLLRPRGPRLRWDLAHRLLPRLLFGRTRLPPVGVGRGSLVHSWCLGTGRTRLLGLFGQHLGRVVVRGAAHPGLGALRSGLGAGPTRTGRLAVQDLREVFGGRVFGRPRRLATGRPILSGTARFST